MQAVGVITTFAGSSIGHGGFNGDGGAATSALLNSPTGVAVDAAGNIYIADNGNAKIRKVNTSGIISTLAGYGTLAHPVIFGYSGDGGAATSAELNSPNWVAVDAAGNIYIADLGNNAIRK